MPSVGEKVSVKNFVRSAAVIFRRLYAVEPVIAEPNPSIVWNFVPSTNLIVFGDIFDVLLKSTKVFWKSWLSDAVVVYIFTSPDCGPVGGSGVTLMASLPQAVNTELYMVPNNNSFLILSIIHNFNNLGFD